MTSMKVYRCDRCGKILTVPQEEDTPFLEFHDFKETEHMDLCIDCSAIINLSRSREGLEAFYELAEKLSQ